MAAPLRYYIVKADWVTCEHFLTLFEPATILNDSNEDLNENLPENCVRVCVPAVFVVDSGSG